MSLKLAWLAPPLLLACIHLAEAQQPKKIPRIGYLRFIEFQSMMPPFAKAGRIWAASKDKIFTLSIGLRVAAWSSSANLPSSGGLISYGANLADLFRRSAVYVDKILRGAKTAELPVEQPTKFELMINLKTAKQIGLAIPPNVLARADRVVSSEPWLLIR